MANCPKQSQPAPETLPVAIIGGGIAGMTAAVQLRRLGADPLLFESGPLGGLLHHASRIDNYPGFPEGITGPTLAARLTEQVKRFDVRVEPARAVRLVWSARSGKFSIDTDKHSFSADRVIVASGTRPRSYQPVLKAPRTVRDRLFDSIVPLRGRRGLRVAVIGASDAAYDYALSLAGPNRVWILQRSGDARAIAPLIGAAAAHPCISIEQDVTVRGFLLRQGGVRIAATKDRKPVVFEVDAVVTAIGREPETGFITPRLRPNIETLEAAGKLWMAGDVVRGRMRQASIAAGDGMRAAMELWNAMVGGTTSGQAG
jgi:thioredoxin reductase (NADPH)